MPLEWHTTYHLYYFQQENDSEDVYTWQFKINTLLKAYIMA